MTARRAADRCGDEACATNSRSCAERADLDGGTAAQSSEDAHSSRIERVVGTHTYALNDILTLVLIHGL